MKYYSTKRSINKQNKPTNDNPAYWNTLRELQESYGQDLRTFIRIHSKDHDKTLYNKALALHSLLSSTPKTHRLPCYQAILAAAEKQLKIWLRN